MFFYTYWWACALERADTLSHLYYLHDINFSILIIPAQEVMTFLKIGQTQVSIGQAQKSNSSQPLSDMQQCVRQRASWSFHNPQWPSGHFCTLLHNGKNFEYVIKDQSISDPYYTSSSEGFVFKIFLAFHTLLLRIVDMHHHTVSVFTNTEFPMVNLKSVPKG